MKRLSLAYEMLKNLGTAVSSTELFHEARRRGDKTSQATYLSLLERLEKKELVKSIPNERPRKFILTSDKPFEKLTHVHSSRPTHKMTRKLKKLTQHGGAE